ncbi:putative toxin-antitoxin system toxin component, PIN family [Phaeodactylibacter xiamenensis]|uniref:putative toxin-antitoxin system toxin component, PIN family n=1 Tax=Phaeodactylibacter xiamenensis TaxID=1524460 RepID=UPI003CCC0C95
MEKAAPKNIILDTNLWISHLISNSLAHLDQLLIEGKVRLIFSEQLLEEFLIVVRRPKFQKYFSGPDIEALLRTFESYGRIASVFSIVEVCRDPKDNFLLALAKDSQADSLITGDQDLLVLQKFGHTPILTYSEFLTSIDLPE